MVYLHIFQVPAVTDPAVPNSVVTGNIPLPPPLPPVGKTNAATAPLSTSSPKGLDTHNYSMISDANDSLNITKLNIVANDNTINATNVLASTVECNPSVNSETVDDFKDLPLHDPNLETVESKPDIIDLVSSPVHYHENVRKLPPLSAQKRVSTAYKYYSFPKKNPAPPRLVSEARGSEDEADDSPEEINENSFPISSFILESWQDLGKGFKNSLQEALVMNKGTGTDTSNNNNDSENSANANAEKIGTSKTDAFVLHSERFGSVFKGKPEKKQGNFFYHEEKFAQYVQLDSDVALIQKPSNTNKKWKLMAHLGEDEVKNVQTSMSYGLYAESHSTAYVRACRKAINQVLLSLNPETEAANIERLHDVKQMLRGVAMAIEQSVQMFIYVHAGLTAQLRSNFLQAQGNYLPTHVKQGLLHELFGGSALFNTQIAKYVENVDKHNNKFHQNKMNAAVVK